MMSSWSPTSRDPSSEEAKFSVRGDTGACKKPVPEEAGGGGQDPQQAPRVWTLIEREAPSTGVGATRGGRCCICQHTRRFRFMWPSR